MPNKLISEKFMSTKKYCRDNSRVSKRFRDETGQWDIITLDGVSGTLEKDEALKSALSKMIQSEIWSRIKDHYMH